MNSWIEIGIGLKEGLGLLLSRISFLEEGPEPNIFFEALDDFLRLTGNVKEKLLGLLQTLKVW